ncbi:hypothetical protein SUDANB174_06014 [Streptomyces sp. enrichment culture]
MDAFEYFGTADTFLPCLLRFLRPGGQLGMATPAMTQEIRELGTIPPHIKKVVGWEAIAWQDWLLWARAGAEHRPDGQSANQPVIDGETEPRTGGRRRPSSASRPGAG